MDDRFATIDMHRKVGRGAAPFRGGELDLRLTQCRLARVKWRLDPSKRLATIHQRYKQTKQDRQRSHSIGRTVLQTVAQKLVNRKKILTGRKSRIR